MYIMEINYQKNYQNTQYNFDVLTEPYTNAGSLSWTSILPEKVFPSGTLMILPPAYSRELWEHQEEVNGVVSSVVTPYHSYSVKFLFNPKGWDKTLLNIGTRAKFTTNKAEQIYRLTVSTSAGTPVSGYPKYTSLTEVIQEQAKAIQNNQVVGYEAVSSPLPLDQNGYLDTSALNSSSYRYRTVSFKVYRSTDFSVFPIVK